MNTSSRRISVINAFIISSIVAVVFVAASTVGAELYHPLKDWLKESFGHHWAGKGVLSVVVLLVLGALLSFFHIGGKDFTRRLIWGLLWFTVLGFAAIAGFFAYEAFFVHG